MGMELETDLDDAGFAEPEETTTPSSGTATGSQSVSPAREPLFSPSPLSPLVQDDGNESTRGSRISADKRTDREAEATERTFPPTERVEHWTQSE